MSKPAKVSDLKSHLGFWMRMVSNHVSMSFAKRLEATGVTVAEWVVLREMYSGDKTTSPSVIADLTGLTRGAISKLIERLLQKGFVSRSEAADDRRYQSIQLTKSAVALVPKLGALADENDEEFFSALTDIERVRLGELLKKVARSKKISQVPVK